ncbi:hypothetical protein KQI08_01895 [Paraeggerthella hongkongensis]|uniref:hypothetical protein n=1 Tax=Paraeggerthella hominis TaxID=2897351 RepID=UPI001C0F7963|nr:MULTISPECIES: hypothetical protein [Paraeggerthella]MBU5404671.1 hypothetical protein [Paraeggerthella hongkongensis]MCD2432367.1 hypothetical protein [Paraeggerthella hominis]
MEEINPQNRIVVGGVDLFERFGMVMSDDCTLSPPAPKTYLVDVPGGSGSIDLTEALTGDVAYGARNQSFVFGVIEPEMFEQLKTEASNFLHGREFDYSLTMDPGYTYHGRFAVDEYYSTAHIGYIKVNVTADPWKTKGTQTYRLDASGGRMYRFECGRRPVQPVIECDQPTKVTTADGEVIRLGKGTYRLNDVVFREGWNDLYINSREVSNTCWYELADGEAHAMTWVQASSLRWDEVMAMNGSSNAKSSAWEDLAETRWAELSETRWADLRVYEEAVGENATYIQYEWSDL